MKLFRCAILFALSKYLPKTFRENRENIQHRLLDARTATEEEMLNCVAERLDGSRLACQITLTDALDGLVVKLPEAQH